LRASLCAPRQTESGSSTTYHIQLPVANVVDLRADLDLLPARASKACAPLAICDRQVLDVWGREMQADELIELRTADQRELIQAFFSEMGGIKVRSADELYTRVAALAHQYDMSCDRDDMQELYHEFQVDGIVRFQHMFPVLEYLLEA